MGRYPSEEGCLTAGLWLIGVSGGRALRQAQRPGGAATGAYSIVFDAVVGEWDRDGSGFMGLCASRG